MSFIDLTHSESTEDGDNFDAHSTTNYSGPDLIMGIDIGPRNTGICVYSIKRDAIVWWVWVDLQGYYPITKSSEIVDRLAMFVNKYRHVFDACDIICVEGQTEAQTQRMNMYLQNGFTGMFHEKITIQNSQSMGKLMREIAPESYVSQLDSSVKVKDKQRRIKKLCTVWVGKKIINKRERAMYVKMIRDRKRHQKFLNSKSGKKKRERMEALDDERLRSQGIGNKKKKNKRIKWSSKLSTEDYDIWDALIVALLEASRQSQTDIIMKRLQRTS